MEAYNIHQKMTEMVVTGDVNSVKSYIPMDVLVPSTKKQYEQT